MTQECNKNNMIQLIMGAIRKGSEDTVVSELKPLKTQLSQTVYQESDALNRLTAVREALQAGEEEKAQQMAAEWLDSLQAFSDLSPELSPLEALNSCLHQHQRQLQIVETNAHIRQVTAMVKGAGAGQANPSQEPVRQKADDGKHKSETQTLLDQIQPKE